MANSKKNNYKTFTEEPWTILKSYFKEDHLSKLVKHQLESYDNFVTNDIKNTIDMFNPVTIRSFNDLNEEHKLYTLEVNIYFKNFSIYKPRIHENTGATKTMFPNEARLRNFTYSSIMTVDLEIHYKIRSGEKLENIQNIVHVMNKIHIGKIPIMLKSCLCTLKQYNHLTSDALEECKHDPGGYFIINGSEKTVLIQERAAENKIFCHTSKKMKWSMVAEIKSVPDNKKISPKQISMYLSKNKDIYSIYLQLPRVKTPIPVFIMFRALGILTDKHICEYVLLDIDKVNYKKILFMLKGSIVEANECLTQEEAFRYIMNNVMYTPINMNYEEGQIKKREFTDNVIKHDLFPHCKTEAQKKYFLGYMINRLLSTYSGWIPTTDRDSYVNKRLDTCGVLLNNLFRNYFNKLVKDMTKQIIKEINNGSWKSTNNYKQIINQTNIYKIIKSSTLENGIKRALATGDFGIKFVNSNKVGVAQVLNRLTYIASLSHLRRVNTPIDKSGKLIPPRQLHSSSFGMLCPAETPEGQSVGVVKNLGYMTHITINSNSAIIYEYIKDKIVLIEDQHPKIFTDKVKVFINGNWIGISESPYKLYKNLKKNKYSGIFNIYTSITFDFQNKEIHICNEAGRLMRPLLLVHNNSLLISKKNIKDLKNDKLLWDDLFLSIHLKTSVLEYVDSVEQEKSYIATTIKDLTRSHKLHKYTHCEIHPSTMFGILASCIPFPEHNQSPRNTYQCAMGKQAIGVPLTNFKSRMDKTSYVLTTPMKPLVDTRIMNMLQLNSLPSGENIIVAIMTHTGYNMEDSILFNKGSIDRGLFQATIFSTEKDEDKKILGDEEIRCKPDKKKTKGIKFGNYEKLNDQGIVEENTLIENRDIIMSKVIPIKNAKNDNTQLLKYQDCSRSYRTNQETYIDKNVIDRNGDGYTFCKVRLRSFRKPSIGDKFSSRHGQKGTIGNIIPEEDMPFNKDGLRPDIIINPHAIPSRMTIAQLKETLLGKLLLELGLFGDGTSFVNLDIRVICNLLLKNNFEKTGNDILYNGETGEQIQSDIFMGPCFYQRLKHMVIDKIHSRSIGPMVNSTRQPPEGRARDGGLRYGEMEKDCMAAHGAAAFTKDRMYNCSDKYHMFICNKCGLGAIFNNKEHIHVCKTCNNKTDFSRVNIPYSAKLLFQELITMNISPRILTNKII